MVPNREIRPEQEIFDDLEKMCTSPGYVHAIAYLCFRDTLVRFVGEITAEDLQTLFSPAHLVRTEISTLIGLLIKGDRDYTLPTAAILQEYLTKTEALLDEMHQAMSKEMFGGLDFEQIIKKGIDPFNRGEALREPIFYSGESAYSFQYRDLSPRKYAADNEWIESNKGFSIHAARDVLNAIEKLQAERLRDVAHALLRMPADEQTILPGFLFTADEAAIVADIDKNLVERVLGAFTLPRAEKNTKFRALHDFNVTNATPCARQPRQNAAHAVRGRSQSSLRTPYLRKAAQDKTGLIPL